jgi:hypothetical protein
MRSLKRTIYGNWNVQNTDGEVMFRCDECKANWYLNRKLAVFVAPTTIRLTFQTKGPGHIGDEFWLQDMYNRCVVCGSEDKLSRHHVVPKQYRQFFPSYLKSHCAYDVLILCITCHKEYEHQADIFKQLLAIEYNSPVFGKGRVVDSLMLEAKRAALTLQKYRQRLPPKRITELMASLKKYYGRDVLEEDVKEAASLNPINDEYIRHAEGVIKQVTNLEVFVQRWRKHFVQKLKPRYLPIGWEETWKS